MKIVILGAEARYRAYQPAMPFIQQQELVFLDKDSTEAEILAAGADAEVLFDHAVYSARLAQRTSTIAGVLWHQGEADCAQELNAVYAEKCTALLAELRKQLDLYDVPFLLGGLGSFLADCPLDANLAHYDKVNAALRQIAATQPMTGFVSAEGLDANPDNLHFSAHSLYVFGRRYFAVYEQLRDKNKRFADKPAEGIRRAMEML